MEYNSTTLPSGAVIKIGISDSPDDEPDKKVTLLGFRLLLSAEEKNKLDYALTEPTIPEPYRKAVNTMMIEFGMADFIDIGDPVTSAGLGQLKDLGIFTAIRIAQINQLILPDGNPLPEVNYYVE
jgi:hypothetical protein